MKVYRAILCWLFWLGAASAAPIPIQTGEHRTFTRVVLTIPAGTNWELGRDDAGYTLTLPINEGYDTRRFFDLIPRDRIRTISQNVDVGELTLTLGCVCYAEAFLDRPNILVIDVRDGLPPANAALEANIDAEPAITKVNSTRRNQSFQIPRNSILPLFSGRSSQNESAEASLPVAVENPPVIRPDIQVEGSSTSNLATLEQSVVESLGRALSQGLLDVDIGNETARSEGETLDKRAPGLTVSTSMDQAAIPNVPSISVTQQGNVCVSDAFVDVANWGDERPYAVQISEARGQLMSEFDTVDEIAVTRLARQFAFFGFGREAIQILELDAITSQERRYLTAIAGIIDGDPVDTTLFTEQVSCASKVALWAALAFADGGMDAKLDRSAVLRTFKSLPPALQRHLAPSLAERFISIGDNDAAFQALEVVSTSSPAPLRADIAEIALTRAIGEEQAAIEQIEKIVSTDARITPEIMIARLTDALQNDRPVSAADFVLVDALRFENAQLPIASELAIAQIRAYLHMSDFTSAKNLLEREGTRIGSERSSVLMAAFTHRATETMPDDDFLLFAFETDVEAVSKDAQNAVARRLLDLGFARRASKLLLDGMTEQPGEERIYLRAEAALALGDLDIVRALLRGYDTDRGRTLMQAVEDMQITQAIVPPDNLSDGISQWRRGDWEELATSDDQLLQAASLAVLDRNLTTLDADTPLTTGRALLAQAAQSRSVVNDLLDRFSGPSDF